MKTLQIRNRRINRFINCLKYTMISYSNHSHITYNLKEMLTFIMAFLQFRLEYVKIQRQQNNGSNTAVSFSLTSLDGARINFKWPF